MATTRIWKVGSNLSRVVDYAKDETKTENLAWSKTDYQTMRDVMDYAMDDAKTEKQFYVTALNCNADYAREQMQMTKRRYDKTDGILAWHGYQSFAEGEVDADTAHKIGVALAKELWPDFEVIVATHLNTHCFHNHFVLNSVSFLHGRKFNACKESYKKMRAASDRLCREYGLSVITQHQAYYPKHYAEWQAEQNGQRTWRSAIREDVDRAVLGVLFTDPAQLQAGDLIFFSRYDPGRGPEYCGDIGRCGTGKCKRWMHIHHVAIYINDEFLIDSTGGENSVQIRKHWGVDTAKWKWCCFGRPTT